VVTQAAAAAGIAVRDGHMYSPRLMRRLGLAVETGAVRVSLAHYNTTGEVKQLGAVLARLRLPAGGAQRESS
jgi:selenocysteine lyase/cysteine desulfurase